MTLAASPARSRLSSLDHWSDTMPATGRSGFGKRSAASPPAGARGGATGSGAAAEQAHTASAIAAPASLARRREGAAVGRFGFIGRTRLGRRRRWRRLPCGR